MLVQALVLHGRREVRLEPLDLPEPGFGELRVRITHATTCGTDLKVYRRGYHARMLQPPTPFGHEAAGEIETAGEGAGDWRPGMRIAWANSAPCGACFHCDRGQEELCDDLLFWNGAYAGGAILPRRLVDRNCFEIPEQMDSARFCLLEPLACAVHGVDACELRRGDQVLILGAGPLGLLLARCAVLHGAHVYVAGRRRQRLRQAAAAGCAAVADVDALDPVEWARALNEGRGPDVVVDATGRTEGWETALLAVRRGGLVNFFGGCPAGSEVALDTTRMHYDCLRLIGSFHHTPRAVRRAYDLLCRGDIDPELVIQEKVSLQGLAERFEELAAGGGPLKLLVEPASESG